VNIINGLKKEIDNCSVHGKNGRRNGIALVIVLRPCYKKAK